MTLVAALAAAYLAARALGVLVWLLFVCFVLYVVLYDE